MVITANVVHQTISAYDASTMRFQATSQTKCAATARKSDAGVLAALLAQDMKCAPPMQATASLGIGAERVLLLGLVRNVESMLLRHRERLRVPHALTAYMMLRHIWLAILYKPLISRRQMPNFMMNA